MSSGGYAAPLRLEISPSRILTTILGVTHAGALALVWLLDIALAFKILLSISIVASVVTTLTRHGIRRSKKAVTSLLWDKDSIWTLFTAAGKTVEVRLLGSSYIHPRLIILNFRIGRAPLPLSVVILPDAADAESLRRLRVRLRVEGRSPPVVEPY